MKPARLPLRIRAYCSLPRDGRCRSGGWTPSNLETRLPHGLLEHVDLAAQDLREALFQLAQPAEVVETRHRESLAQPHGQIHVMGRAFTASDGTEQRHALHAGASKLLLMLPQRG